MLHQKKIGGARQDEVHFPWMLVHSLLDRGKNARDSLDFIEDHVIGARPKAGRVALALPQCVKIVESDVFPALGRLFVPQERALAYLARSGEDHDRVLGDGARELGGEPAGYKI